MRESEVPQEKNRTLDGNRKAVYALGEDGEYKTVASDGWSVEEIVTSQAVEEFERLAKETLARVKDKKTSALEYYMYKNRMDLSLLSQTTGFFRWTIKRDFNPARFAKIPASRAEVYASVMGIGVDELLKID